MIKIVICEDNFSCREKLKENLEIILNKLTNQFEIIVFNCGEDLINNYPEDAYEKVNKYGSRKKN
ncbi:hypothetical protein C672_0111 [[Clostridium] bifermentans ATCC 638]|uniref:Uncharacterized protein n=1 Tax=Paraclostridium bifermentans ATCC 638 = DSM 14991 TaxID=1233171 RepID=T4VYQ2_PARBF|nr:hypothetical protein [Paraclostridium bifermentans]EQK46240.1 hypothetical protein C672_0111 [[Clostridium] bifermentans ATCC 638] [Paraclostridium bifermentans ATCC 638 = DSM 14991]RIZ57478.1 hypothetical protein CHH45_16305 [Paraclostridium bifermentans]UAG17975.1 hypothetical protein KXZ80_14585 [Paraclostridium bifermentans]